MADPRSCESKIKAWFSSVKRDFPWRKNTTPYATWVSEVMLQQTQASVVIPYFQHWMEKFPTLEALANAELDEVLKVWEGLGYYSRARNLHTGAKEVLKRHSGLIPKDRKSLLQIKGIGEYTADAILAFAFHEFAVPVDGNVLRVGLRYFGLSLDIASPKTRQEIKQRFSNWIPQEEPWVTAEGLIELGATVCMRRPNCPACPLRSSCVARQMGIEHELPINSRKTKTENIYRAVAVIASGDSLLARRGEGGRVMADLYEFPYWHAEKPWTSEELCQTLEQFGLTGRPVVALDEVQHTFTRFRARLYPWVFHADAEVAMPGYSWIPFNELLLLPFSAGHRRILNVSRKVLVDLLKF